MNLLRFFSKETWLALLLTLLVAIALLLSLLPIVSWWGGILALPVAGYYFYLKRSPAKEFLPWQRRIYRLARWSVVFGIVLHLSCRMYSSYRIHELSEECQQQKAAIRSASQEK